MTRQEIAEMTLELAEREAENLSQGEIIDMLINGHVGYNDMDAGEIHEMYMRLYLA